MVTRSLSTTSSLRCSFIITVIGSPGTTLSMKKIIRIMPSSTGIVTNMRLAMYLSMESSGVGNVA